MITDPKISGYGRDAILDLILKMVPRTDGIDWVRRFMDDKGMRFVSKYKHDEF